MSDLVGTCPKDFWEEWLAEGDCAGDPETGIGWTWNTKSWKAKSIKPGDRFYVVAHGKLRGWATVVDVEQDEDYDGSPIFCIIRKGGAVACTIPSPIPGFRGLRSRWWNRSIEIPFPDWRTA